MTSPLQPGRHGASLVIRPESSGRPDDPASESEGEPGRIRGVMHIPQGVAGQLGGAFVPAAQVIMRPVADERSENREGA